MKLPYSAQLTKIDGSPIVKAFEVLNEDGTIKTPAVPFTLKDALVAAFEAHHKDDEAMSPADRYAFGKLGFDIGAGADLTVGEVAKAKDRAGKVLVGVLVFPVWNLIESAASVPEVAA